MPKAGRECPLSLDFGGRRHATEPYGAREEGAIGLGALAVASAEVQLGRSAFRWFDALAGKADAGKKSLGRVGGSPLPLFMVGPAGLASEARTGRTAKWACALSTPPQAAIWLARWMLPSCDRRSKAMSPLRPRVRGCRASWSRPCRCRHRTGMHRAAPAEAESRGHQTQDPQPHGSGLCAFAGSVSCLVQLASDSNQTRQLSEWT
jgi:hypothetical protein